MLQDCLSQQHLGVCYDGICPCSNHIVILQVVVKNSVPSFKNQTPLSLLKQKNYQFAILGGNTEDKRITFWNSNGSKELSFGWNLLLRYWNQSWDFQHHSAAVLPDDTVLVIGGFDFRFRGNETKNTKVFHHLNLSNGIEVLGSGEMPGPPRSHHESAAHSDGRVIVCGGWDGTDSYGALASCTQYLNGSWTTAPTMLSKRKNFGMTSDGQVAYAVGGEIAQGSYSSSVEVYKPGSDKWESIGYLPRGPRAHISVVYSKGKIYVIGGQSRYCHPCEYMYGVVNTVEIYDTVSKRWSSGPSLTTPRKYHTAVATPDGSIWVFGSDYTWIFRNKQYKTVEVLPFGGSRWIRWPHKLPRRVSDARIIVL